MPDIDVSLSKDGIVRLPDNVPGVFKKYFVKYTKILSPNGKPIHILAQDGWTNDQIKHGRNVLEHILEDAENSKLSKTETTTTFIKVPRLIIFRNMF